MRILDILPRCAYLIAQVYASYPVMQRCQFKALMALLGMAGGSAPAEGAGTLAPSVPNGL